jgi:hypothetical protein
MNADLTVTMVNGKKLFVPGHHPLVEDMRKSFTECLAGRKPSVTLNDPRTGTFVVIHADMVRSVT